MLHGQGIHALRRLFTKPNRRPRFKQVWTRTFLTSFHSSELSTLNSTQRLSLRLTTQLFPQICGSVARHFTGASSFCQKMEDLNEKFTSTVITGGQDANHKEGCIFCSIAAGTDTKNKIIYQNSEVVVFHDIRPASKEHLLIIPSNHIGSVKGLAKEDKPKLEYLFEVGKAVLEKRGGDISQSRCGFHWPPFHSIEHLHLHIICPAAEMTFLKRQIYRPNSLWFVTYEWTLDWLEKQSNKKDSES